MLHSCGHYYLLNKYLLAFCYKQILNLYSIELRAFVFIIIYYLYILHFREILFIHYVSTMVLVIQLMSIVDVDKTNNPF